MHHGTSESSTRLPTQNKLSSTKESEKYFIKPNFSPSVTNKYVWIKWGEVVCMSEQKLGEELELECKPSVTASESNAQEYN